MNIDSNTYPVVKSDEQNTGRGGTMIDKQKRNARQAAWYKENAVQISVRFQKSTDADILAYLEGKQKQTEIKKALRLLIEQEEHNQ